MLLLLSIIIGSWGTLGHQTVAKIAENHLSPKAKKAVAELLGKETPADVANWADEIRSLPEYKYAAPLHYINVPPGLNYNEFSKAVASQQADNIYTAILNCKKKLLDKSTTREQKTEALKFLVHFVGDAHQPMHVSRAEDKGGNTIQVQFDGSGTNLHALWDSKLIDHQGFDLEKMVKKYDQANDKEITEWQHDEVLKWLFESYEISGTLYAETAKEHILTEDYYKAHIPIVEKRVEQGGIRLAGLLNEIFKDGLTPSVEGAAVLTKGKADEESFPVKAIDEVAKNIGNQITIIDVVADYKIVNPSLTLLNLGGRYPDQKLTIALKGNACKLNPAALKNKKIQVSGMVELYKNKPEIIITSLDNINIYKSH